MKVPSLPQPIDHTDPPNHPCEKGGSRADLVRRGTRAKANGSVVQRFWCPACGQFLSGGPVEHLRPLHTPENTRAVWDLAVKGRSIEAIAKTLAIPREAVRLRLGKLEQEARRQNGIHPPGVGTGYESVESELTWRGQAEPHTLVAAVGVRRTSRRLLGWVVVKAGEEAIGRAQLHDQFGEALTVEAHPPALDWLRKSLGAGWTLARNQAAIEQRLWLLMAWSHGWRLTGGRAKVEGVTRAVSGAPK